MALGTFGMIYFPISVGMRKWNGLLESLNWECHTSSQVFQNISVSYRGGHELWEKGKSWAKLLLLKSHELVPIGEHLASFALCADDLVPWKLSFFVSELAWLLLIVSFLALNGVILIMLLVFACLVQLVTLHDEIRHNEICYEVHEEKCCTEMHEKQIRKRIRVLWEAVSGNFCCTTGLTQKLLGLLTMLLYLC